MENKIKAIKTEYNGYMFRSRLEARWAVFFDAARIEYEYEPEGYTLSDGTNYLPDFWLPQFEIFVEIKPSIIVNKPMAKKQEANDKSEIAEHNKLIDKLSKFRNESGKSIVLFRGDPALDVCGLLFAFSLDDSGGGAQDCWCKFVDVSTKPDKSIIILQVNDDRRDRDILVNSSFVRNKRVCNSSMMCDLYWTYVCKMLVEPFGKPYDCNSSAALDRAKTESRKARFEFMEKPCVH